MSRIEPKTTQTLDTTEPLPLEKLPAPRRKLRVRSGLRAGADYVEPMKFSIKPYDA